MSSDKSCYDNQKDYTQADFASCTHAVLAVASSWMRAAPTGDPFCQDYVKEDV